MTDAKKCDKCGEFYLPRTVSGEYQIRRDQNDSSTTPSIDYQPMDLCMDCYRSFKGWLEGSDD